MPHLLAPSENEMGAWIRAQHTQLFGLALRSDDQLLSEDPAWRASSASMPHVQAGADLRAALPQLAGAARGAASAGQGLGQGFGPVVAASAALQQELDLGAWLRLSSLPAQVPVFHRPSSVLLILLWCVSDVPVHNKFLCFGMCQASHCTCWRAVRLVMAASGRQLQCNVVPLRCLLRQP